MKDTLSRSSSCGIKSSCGKSLSRKTFRRAWFSYNSTKRKSTWISFVKSLWSFKGSWIQMRWSSFRFLSCKLSNLFTMPVKHWWFQTCKKNTLKRSKCSSNRTLKRENYPMARTFSISFFYKWIIQYIHLTFSPATSLIKLALRSWIYRCRQQRKLS